jgi:NAD(P)-dependent dehydrogenase (short-subunit alcohol dehydrogenase family)
MKTAMVTGANRGIGLSFVKALLEKGYQVYACCRDPDGASDLNKLAQNDTRVQIKPLDICDDKSITNLKNHLPDTPIDCLVNNAGISGERGVSINHINKDNFLKVFETNCYGTLKVSDTFLANVKVSEEKLIVVISSRMGSIADNEQGGSYAYRASKAALNAVMKSFAVDVKAWGVGVMLFHPGWVKTDMGGDKALVTPDESVQGMLKQMQDNYQPKDASALLRFDGDSIAW